MDCLPKIYKSVTQLQRLRSDYQIITEYLTKSMPSDKMSMMSIEANPSNMAGMGTQFPPVTYSSSFVSYLIQVNIYH